jgi:ribosome biogenesis GTPase
MRGEGLIPARVVKEHRGLYTLYAEIGGLSGEVTGKLRHAAGSKDLFPAVGDWVTVQVHAEGNGAAIHGVLPRKSAFARKVAGAHTEAQIVAANVDTAFLVSGLDGDFSVRRIERYLALAWESGASPVIVLNKTDLCGDVDARVSQVEPIAFGVPILTMSATENQGTGSLRGHLEAGRTAAFMGSSGVGKSTLINSLLGTARQRVQDVREGDSRGRHTTSQRELILLPEGGLVIDTPGMRELQLWLDEEGLTRSFDDVECLARRCRFRDCAHATEPGCAVRTALQDGSLDSGRYAGYVKLKKELQHLERRKDQRARLAEKAKWKRITKEHRRRNSDRS